MISPLLDEILRAAVTNGASDVILRAGQPAVLRINGELAPIESELPSGQDLIALWTACGAEGTELDRDASLTTEDGVRFRVNLLKQLGVMGAVLRRIQNQIPAMETLGLPCDLLREWAARPSGIVIVCGPTGSGKSTTMASVLDWVNTTMARHVVTIEDPVEFLFTSKASYFTQREVGIDTPTFAEGLRRSLRQNPDIIFLGEIRDAASAITAIQAAETGHLVFGTVHASGCSDVVARLELLFPPEERESVRKTLSAQLHGILCQRLLPAVAGGRILLTEYFSNEASSRRLISEGRMSELQDFISRGDPRSARSFADSLIKLVRDGSVAEAVALENADNPQEFTRTLRGISSSMQSTRR
ncbi:MAG: PilT/PilU family type 4a pilus ATPase [Verrucomicrobiota bacterium]